eukprot:COSAG01_NODE_8299_length_2839_cov_1.814599_3_plen_111_part_00
MRAVDSRACELETEALCGVYHASELRFVFDNYQVPLAHRDREMADVMGQLWTSFAKKGVPTAAGQPQWPRYNRSSDLHLELAFPLKVVSHFRQEQCDFWDSLPGQTDYPH